MKNKSRRIIKGTLIIVLILGLLYLIFWPTSNYIEGPGDANNLNSMVRIDHHTGRYSGKLMLTSVGIAPAHPITYLWAKLNPEYSIDNAGEVTGNQKSTEYNRVQKFYMQSAINNAIYVAYRKAHRFVKPRYRGIYVIDVMRQSRFNPGIKVGDLITTINHHHFNDAAGYQRYLTHLSHDTRVTVQYVRHGNRHRITRPLTKLPKTRRWGLGVVLTDDMAVKTRIPVSVNFGKIGGPSGGLMFALQMYSQLKPVNLTKGRKIAGTGTVDSHGNVGEIGGIDKKVIAAKRKGATIFFAPYVKSTPLIRKYEPDHLTNYQLAKRAAHKYAPRMKIVPVENFQQAVEYLETT